jgi:hypothetical protein
MTFDVVAQVGIALTGATAIFVVGLKEPRRRRWGFVLGVCGQPFWIYTTWNHEQWGILLLTAVYTYSWINGLRNHWVHKECHKG